MVGEGEKCLSLFSRGEPVSTRVKYRAARSICAEAQIGDGVVWIVGEHLDRHHAAGPLEHVTAVGREMTQAKVFARLAVALGQGV